MSSWTDLAPHGGTARVRITSTRMVHQFLARIVLVLSDTLGLALAFMTAHTLRFNFGVALVLDVEPTPGRYLQLVSILIPLWLVLYWMMGLYDFHNLLGGTTEYARILNACTSGMMLVIVASFMVPEFQISRSWLILSWLLTAAFATIGRLALRRAAYRLRDNGLFVLPAIIVGTNLEAHAMARQLRDARASGLNILGFVETGSTVPATREESEAGLPILGELAALPNLIRARRIEEVVIATTALSREQLVQISEQLAAMPEVEMQLSSGLYEIYTTGMRVTTRNYVPLMSVNRVRLDSMELALKSLLDYTIILASLPFLILVFATIGVLIKLDSPGPIFYRRRVVGMGGKEFDAFKFRTMVVNGDEVLAQYPHLEAELRANHKLKEDPRITRIGGWLRRTSLDELPQLVNVLLGQMSLVGPRMITKEEMGHYGKMRFNLLTVKPGLTGLWQVSGRSDLTYMERTQLDMHYVRNYTIWMDLQILFVQTIPAVFKKRGAY